MNNTTTDTTQSDTVEFPDPKSDNREASDSTEDASNDHPDLAGDRPLSPAEGDDQDDEHGGNREAAKYRRRLRDTEAERDTLATLLEDMQRTEAERQAGEVLAKGAALWVGGTTLADLLDDDGHLDPDKIRACAEEVREQYGIPKPKSGLHVPREGYSPGTPRSSGADGMVSVVMGRQQ
ncbi:hypothetical protein [Mycolicibacterium sp. CR10]|uniref:hypothetical protein n=1 Tax=Mycolicibacterium sp. CR10 TaxID=2562314 RepID=UPI0010C05841|nr:hypothetical protein [Mycolicibacterium sp. CR10]